MSRPAKRAKKTLLAAKRGLIRGTVSRRFEAELRCYPSPPLSYRKCSNPWGNSRGPAAVCSTIPRSFVTTPILVTASGGPEHLVDGGNGVVIPPRDPTVLRNALIRMRDEADRYDRAAIRASALRLYGPEAFARGFAENLG